MILQEIAQIRACIQQIRELKLPERLAKQFPTVDLSQQRFSNFTGSELIAHTDRLLEQFSEALESADAPFLSKGYYWETHYQGMAHRHIVGVIQQLTNYYSNSQWDGAAQYLELAIGYLIQIGRWDRSARRLQSVSKLRQSELFKDLETKAAQVREMLSLLNGIQEQHQQEILKRQSEINSVSNQLMQAQKSTAEIAALLAKSTGHDGQLTQILATQKANLDKTKDELGAISEGKTQLIDAITAATEKLRLSEERLRFMEDKSEWVNELAGTAAAGVLGQKFEARMRELATSSRWWLGGTIASVVAGAVWSAIAHKFLMQSSSDFWLTLALNFGLLLPALFIVGFFAKQAGWRRVGFCASP